MTYRTIKESVITELTFVQDETGATPVKMKLRLGDAFNWEEVDDDYVAVPNEKCRIITWTKDDGKIEEYLDNNGGNIMFDTGHGVQELFGVIWYDDGSWSERAEYDGSEWWAYKQCPNFDEYEA